jgi:hypothetical protein
MSGREQPWRPLDKSAAIRAWLSPNDCREEMGLPAVDGGDDIARRTRQHKQPESTPSKKIANIDHYRHPAG